MALDVSLWFLTQSSLKWNEIKIKLLTSGCFSSRWVLSSSWVTNSTGGSHLKQDNSTSAAVEFETFLNETSFTVSAQSAGEKSKNGRVDQMNLLWVTSRICCWPLSPLLCLWNVVSNKVTSFIEVLSIWMNPSTMIVINKKQERAYLDLTVPRNYFPRRNIRRSELLAWSRRSRIIQPLRTSKEYCKKLLQTDLTAFLLFRHKKILFQPCYQPFCITSPSPVLRKIAGIFCMFQGTQRYPSQLYMSEEDTILSRLLCCIG